MSSLPRLEQQQKRFLKIQFEVSYFSFFPVIIWNWSDKYVHTLSYFPQKPNPIPDQNRQSLYSFSDQNAAKTLPFVAAHTLSTYLYSLFKKVPPHPHPKTQVPCPRKRENTGKEPEEKGNQIGELRTKPDVSL